MSLTVGELVTRQQLRLELLVAGDLDREIRWIHSSDMPDPAPYLRGGEVVLTAGIWYWHGVAPSTFAAGLGHANAAALGFGTNPLVSEVPADLVRACEKWGLTLFRVPEGVAFIEIAEEFVEAQHRDRERPLLDSLDRSTQFLYSLQAEGGVGGLVRTLAPFLARRVAVVQRGRGAVVAGTPGTLPRDLVAAAEAVIGTRAPAIDLGGGDRVSGSDRFQRRGPGHRRSLIRAHGDRALGDRSGARVPGDRAATRARGRRERAALRG